VRNSTSTSISDHWRTLSPYLDKALELEPAERSIWIRSQDPELANQLGLLLREHDELASEGFLENRTPELPPACSTLAGQTLGVYQLISQIGQGGMGSVWLAKRNDGRFERRVAIKFLNIAFIGKTGEERFRREGKILGLLGHENIAELIDAGVTRAGQPYLVLEYVDGEQIDHYCNHHRLDIRSRLTLFLDVLEAVAKAHANLIIHRDLKPSNILVRNDRLVKLLDFGIAKLVDTEDSPGAAAAFTIGGQALTPQYAAPEQLQGGQITTATDVYALGGLLYLLLTGQHSANRGQNTHAELLKAIIDSEPVRPSEIFSRTRAYRILSAAHAANASTSPEKLRRLLNGDLNTIVLKALKKGPAERYESVTAFADDLRRHLKNQPISACADTMTYRAFKFVRRNRTVVALAALAVFTTTAGLIGTLLQQRNVRIQRDLAVRQLARAERTADLNELLLSDVAPNGKPLTAGQLLLQEESVLQHEHNPDPINHVELLLSLGDQYSGADDNQSALRVLNHAYQLSRALRDSSIRAKASCVLAEALLPVGELARAEALFQQGLDEIADGSRSAATQAFCLVRGSEVAYRNGNSQQAIARARAAERMLQASSSHWNLQELNVLINLAGVLGDAGKFREANQIFERASALITNLGYDSTQKAVKLFNDWALTLSYDGRQLQAERIYRRAIDISRTDETKNAVPPVLLFNYASLLRELGRSGEAAPYLQSAINKSRDANDKILVDQAELLQGRMYSDQGDYRRAEAIFKELEPRLRSKFPPNHYAFAALASERSRLSLETGDIKAALRFADLAVELDEGSIRNIGRCAAYLPILLIRRSRVEIAAQLYPQAEADAVSAMQLLNVQSESGVHSSNIGRAYLALSLALKSQGKSIDAQSASREALTNLQDTLGDRHPDTLAALDLAKRDSAIN
jgi:serine/threonine protein kinase/tetratricopeptide (TPR) repeat protein